MDQWRQLSSSVWAVLADADRSQKTPVSRMLFVLHEFIQDHWPSYLSTIFSTPSRVIVLLLGRLP